MYVLSYLKCLYAHNLLQGVRGHAWAPSCVYVCVCSFGVNLNKLVIGALPHAPNFAWAFVSNATESKKQGSHVPRIK